MLTWTDYLTWNPTWTDMLTWSPAVLTVSVVKKRCISCSAKQKMQSAVASIHQLQAISCCKQKSRPAVDTTDGSAGVKSSDLLTWSELLTWSPAVLTVSVVKKRCISRRLNRRCNQLLQAFISCKQSAVANRKANQMLINRGESAVGTTNSKTADEIYKEEPTADERYEEKTTAERTAVEQFVGVKQVSDTAEGWCRSSPGARLGDWVCGSNSSSGTFPWRKKGRRFSSGIFRMFLLHTRSVSGALCFYVQEPELLIYQMLINRGESAVGTTNSKTADEIYKEEPTADERYEEKTTAERTAVEQFAGIHSDAINRLNGKNQWLKLSRANALI
ncbi:hypothetical protein F511_23140 [Dorcoceras hygrometricum]|uniref:Uncharacterized protein n=1 Tax=Dorcoceras hygrometricum TaxID=472368 RepID=A0A2Z7BDC1_9LAMI|nr:hypothetical protein F511_23140 [Dorcoceras hygrometricum]